jgi:hypothetical protein
MRSFFQALGQRAVLPDAWVNHQCQYGERREQDRQRLLRGVVKRGKRALGITLTGYKATALPNYSGFHQTVCLGRREPLISAMALREFEYRERLTVYQFRGRKDLS